MKTSFAILLITISQSLLAAPAYKFTDLGVEAGQAYGTYSSNESFAQSVNNKGEVVGYTKSNYFMGTGYQPTLWVGGQTINIGTSTGLQGFAMSINNLSQVVGYSFGGTSFKWEAGNATTLQGIEVATGINDHGKIIGNSTLKSGFSHAFIYKNGLAEDLTPGLLGNTSPIAINNSGTIVAYSTFNGVADGRLFFEGGQVQVLPSPPIDEYLSPRDINDIGEIVGVTSTYGGPNYGYNYLLSNGNFQRLQVLPDYNYCGIGVSAINNNGLIVGTACGRGSTRAVLWDRSGQIIDLNSYLPAGFYEAGWSLYSAEDINDHGWIVGSAYNNSLGFRAYILSPEAIPVPSSLLLLLSGGIFMLVSKSIKIQNSRRLAERKPHRAK